MVGFGIAHRCWADDPRFGVDEIAVLSVLSMFADVTGRCYASQETIGQKLRKDRWWVCRVLGRIVTLAPDVLLKKRTQGVNNYWLLGHPTVMKILRKNRPSDDSNVREPQSGNASGITSELLQDAHKQPQSSRPSNIRPAAEPEPEVRPEPTTEALEVATQIVKDAELEGPNEQKRVRDAVAKVLRQSLGPWKDRKRVIRLVAMLLASGVPVDDTGVLVRLGDPAG